MAGHALGVQRPGDVLDLRIPELVAQMEAGRVGVAPHVHRRAAQERSGQLPQERRAGVVLRPDVREPGARPGATRPGLIRARDPG